MKSWFIGKDPDPGKDWRQNEKSSTEDETVGWHHWCNGHELGKTPGDGGREGGLVCCSPWGCEEFDTSWQLNNNNKTEQNSRMQVEKSDNLCWSPKSGLWMNQHYRKLLKIFPTSCFTIFNQCRARRINSLDVNSPHSLFNLRKCLSKHQDWGHFRKILNTCEDCFLVFVFPLSLTTDHLQQQS